MLGLFLLRLFESAAACKSEAAADVSTGWGDVCPNTALTEINPARARQMPVGTALLILRGFLPRNKPEKLSLILFFCTKKTLFFH
jgi:hypothetical protein